MGDYKGFAHCISVSSSVDIAHAGTGLALPHFVKDSHGDDDVIRKIKLMESCDRKRQLLSVFCVREDD